MEQILDLSKVEDKAERIDRIMAMLINELDMYNDYVQDLKDKNKELEEENEKLKTVDIKDIKSLAETKRSWVICREEEGSNKATYIKEIWYDLTGSIEDIKTTDNLCEALKNTKEEATKIIKKLNIVIGAIYAKLWIKKNIDFDMKKERSADKMFEDLGYEKETEEDGSIQYVKNGDITKDDFEIIIISFEIENTKWVFSKIKDYNMSGITPKELKAINKKMEELNG